MRQAPGTPCRQQLRGEAVRPPVQERDLPHVLEAEHDHERAREAEPEAAVGRHAVAEEVEVELDGAEFHTLLFRLAHQHVVAVFALRTGGDLEPLPEEVEALGHLGPAGVAHVVERAHLDRVVGHENELVPELLPNVGADAPLALGVEIPVVLSRDVMAEAFEDSVGLVHRDPRERNLGNHDVDAERLLDLLAVDLSHPRERVGEPALLEGHDVLVGINPRDLHVHAGELGVVPRRERRIGAEHRTDLEDPVEPRGHGHLLVELRALGETGRAVEVLDLEQLGAALAGAAHQLRRMNLDEALGHPVLAHGLLDEGLDAEGEQVLRAAQVDVAPVKALVDRGRRLNRQRLLGDRENLDARGDDLEVAELDALVGRDEAGDRDRRVGRQSLDDATDLVGSIVEGVGDLGHAGAVPDNHELDVLQVANLRNPAHDRHGLSHVGMQVIGHRAHGHSPCVVSAWVNGQPTLKRLI